MVGCHLHKEYLDLNPFNSIIVKAMHAGTWIWNLETNESIYNDRWAEMLGYTLNELEPISLDTWRRLAHPDDLARSDAEFIKLIAKEIEYYSIVVRIKHKKGHWVHILDSGQIVKWSVGGKPLVALGTHIDITDQKQAEIELSKSEQNLSQIMEHAFDIIYRFDVNNQFIYLSSAWTKRLGHPRETVVGHSFKPFVHPDDLPRLEHFFAHLSQTEESHTLTNYRLRHCNGKYYYYETNAAAIVEDGIVTGYAGIARDITQLLEKQRQIEYMSYHDYLTGFYNRHYLDVLAPSLLSLENLPMCIISIDLNDLKTVNDTYGHHVGDYYIKQVTTLIKTIIPTTDLFRMGGDEFLCIVKHTQVEDALMYRTQLFEQIAKMRIENFKPSIAFGFEVKTQLDEDIYESIKKADAYMYLNKAKVKQNYYK